MQFRDTWFLSIDDEFRQYLNVAFASIVILFMGLTTAYSYKHLNEKAQLTEFYTIITQLKLVVQEHYAFHHEFPSNEILQTMLQDTSLVPAAEYSKVLYSNVEFDNGGIIVTFESDIPDINDTTLSFFPIVDPNINGVFWRCGYGNLPTQISSIPEHQTTLPPKYLVNICKE